MAERNAPPEFCQQVLRLLQEAKVLDEIILIGSWCSHYYRSVIPGAEHIGAIRTGDLDLLIPRPARLENAPAITAILDDMGFVVEHSPEGYTRMVHPLMAIDFIVPERGRGTASPVKVPGLSVRASALRFMDFLAGTARSFDIGGIALRMPDPVRYGLHKLIVSERRPDKGKAERDRQLAVDILRALAARAESGKIKNEFRSMPKGWRTAVGNALKKVQAEDLQVLVTQEPA